MSLLEIILFLSLKVFKCLNHLLHSIAFKLVVAEAWEDVLAAGLFLVNLGGGATTF